MPPHTVLFVDDDSEESYLFNEALEHSGLEIELERANNGVNLINYLQSKPLPDLVVMDINMPYKDGLEALEEIRNDPKFEKLPVVIYSTTINEDSINASFEKGANLFVVKPNNFDGMVKVVKQVCALDWNNFYKPTREKFVVSEH